MQEEPVRDDCIINNIVSIQNQESALYEARQLNISRIGHIECLQIMKCHFNVDEIERRIQDIQSNLSAKGLLDLPLMTAISRNGSKYNIVLLRVDKTVNGEFEYLDDFINRFSIDPTLKSNAERLEERLLSNSVYIYDSLATSLKLSAFGRKFKGLVTSKKRKYLYYYLPDKKRAIAFAAVRCK